MDFKDWKEKNKKAKNYAHFDLKVSLENVLEYIKNPKNIAKHGFYPFIQYEKRYVKYGRNGVREKIRRLCYSSHIDRYIYSYYGYMINEKYNEYMAKRNIDKVAIAYRNNLGKNNIHFAKDAFDFIRKMNKCIVIIGDFTDFFDSLNHIYLKSRLCELLECDKLENDYYAVFKNITKYSVWNLTDLLELNSLEDTMQGRKILNSRDRVLSKEDFKKYAKRFITVPNVEKKKDCGIPQGAAISAVLANVYMMKVDEEIQRLVSEYDGLYMRYSDDFIIVLSEQKCKDLDNVIVEIREKIKLVKLTLQDEKTKCYRYENFRVLNCDGEKTAIDYLGFYL